MTQQKISASAQAKQEWARPELRRIEAGSAESQSGSRSDGGGGLQGS